MAGSQHGLQIAARALLNDGDAVWMEEPGYPGAHRAFAIAGVRAVPVPVDQEGLDVDSGLRRCPDARAAYITPSHQYPMGMTLTRPPDAVAGLGGAAGWLDHRRRL